MLGLLGLGLVLQDIVRFSVTKDAVEPGFLRRPCQYAFAGSAREDDRLKEGAGRRTKMTMQRRPEQDGEKHIKVLQGSQVMTMATVITPDSCVLTAVIFSGLLRHVWTGLFSLPNRTRNRS